MGNRDGGLHDATTSGEGPLTKHVPSFVCENQKRCAQPTCAPPPVPIIDSPLSRQKRLWQQTNMPCIRPVSFARCMSSLICISLTVLQDKLIIASPVLRDKKK